MSHNCHSHAWLTVISFAERLLCNRLMCHTKDIATCKLHQPHWFPHSGAELLILACSHTVPKHVILGRAKGAIAQGLSPPIRLQFLQDAPSSTTCLTTFRPCSHGGI